MTSTSKSRGGFAPAKTCNLYVSVWGGGEYLYTSAAGLLDGCDLEETSGQILPNFYARRRSGELLPYTYFHQYAKKSISVAGKLSYHQTVAPFWTGRWDPGVPFDSSYYGPTKEAMLNAMSDKDFTYLVQAAAARIYSSGWDVGTFAAELQQTIRMFEGLISKILGIVRGKPLDMPWNLWLEGRYGWRTLSYDLDDLIKAIINIDDKRRRWKESCTTTETWQTVSSQTNYAPQHNDLVTWTYHYECGIRGSVAADIIPPKLQANPLITAWEITKFSFVIDWALNVGQWLASMSFLALSTAYTAAGGIKLTCYSTVTHEGTANAGYIIDEGAIRSVVTKTECIRRVPTSISTIPQLSVRLDTSKLIDLLALLAQAYFNRR